MEYISSARFPQSICHHILLADSVIFLLAFCRQNDLKADAFRNLTLTDLTVGTKYIAEKTHKYIYSTLHRKIT